jgi:hypothetical protein
MKHTEQDNESKDCHMCGKPEAPLVRDPVWDSRGEVLFTRLCTECFEKRIRESLEQSGSS